MLIVLIELSNGEFANLTFTLKPFIERLELLDTWVHSMIASALVLLQALVLLTAMSKMSLIHLIKLEEMVTVKDPDSS